MSALPDTQAQTGGVTLNRMVGAERYNTWLLDRARPYLGGRVLDVGAGLGTFTALVAPGRDVVAVEPDARCAAVLRRRFGDWARVTVVERDAATLDAETLGTFDSVLCLNVLEHVRDDVAALAAFSRLLRPGGHLLLLVPAHPVLYGAIDRTVGHERRYTKDALRRALESGGLVAEQLRHVNPLGALGWLAASRLTRQDDVPAGPLRAYDRLVPVLRLLDRLPLPFGLSLWAVARA